MSALERLINAYEQLSDPTKCADTYYFQEGRKGLVAAARQEQAELVAALRAMRELAEPYTVKPTIDRIDALLSQYATAGA